MKYTVECGGVCMCGQWAKERQQNSGRQQWDNKHLIHTTQHINTKKRTESGWCNRLGGVWLTGQATQFTILKEEGFFNYHYWIHGKRCLSAFWASLIGWWENLHQTVRAVPNVFGYHPNWASQRPLKYKHSGQLLLIQHSRIPLTGKHHWATQRGWAVNHVSHPSH